MVAWLASGTEGQKDLGQKKVGWVWPSYFFALNFFATRMLFRSGSVVGLGSRGAKRSRAKKGGMGLGFLFFCPQFFCHENVVSKW